MREVGPHNSKCMHAWPGTSCSVVGTAENEKQIKCPLQGSWVNKLWNSYIM